MRPCGLPGTRRSLARGRLLALAVVAGMVTAVVGTSAGAASASAARYRPSRPEAHSGLSLGQAPPGLRAAVHRTLGLPAVSSASAFQKAKLTASNGVAGNGFGYSVAISGSLAVIGTPGANSGAGTAYLFVLSRGKWSQLAETADPGATAGDSFGSSVAISGSTAVVAADGSNHSAGVVYVYVRSGSTWSEQAQLADPAANFGDGFGDSLVLSGSTLVVGAPNSNSGAGAAYVFTGSGSSWSQQAVLADPGASAVDGFGNSVAISGSTLVVGAAGSPSGGAAYVFTGSGSSWSQQAKLTDPGGATGDNFGSVAVSGSTLVVGANGTSSNTGAAYVFTGSGSSWSQRAKLTAAGGAANDGFGGAVAVSGSTVVVGAAGSNSFAGAGYVFTGSGSTWYQQAELTDPGGVTNDFFGRSVAMSGSTALVGAEGSNSGTGAAYVYALPSQQGELTATGGAASDRFGFSVAVSGSTAVVGAPNSNSGAGSAYVFTRSGSTWSEQAQLTTTGGAVPRGFGYSVAISGSTVVVGAPYTGSLAGAAYVFTGSGATWSQQAPLTGSGESGFGFFGYSVAISGSTAVVGAYADSNTGAAYVFLRSGTTWSQQTRLTDPNNVGGDHFGWSVAIAGSTAVVGADGTNTNTGSAYVYVRSAGIWSSPATLSVSGGVSGDGFGYSVAIAGFTVVVGAPYRYSGGGAAYVFTGSGSSWSQQAQLTAVGGATGDHFGWSVAISGSTAMAGAAARNSAAGQAYLFTRSGTTWSQQAQLIALDGAANNAFGNSVAISKSTAVIGSPYSNSSTGTAYVFANM